MTFPGPSLFGRGVIVADGATPPAPWAGCDRVRVDASTMREPADVVSALHDAWMARTSVVVELAVDPAEIRDARSYGGPVEQYAPAFEPWFDRLHFLLWANTYDARAGDPVWWWASKAERAGARPLADGDVGDVLLADGTPAWIDGGPVDQIDPADVLGAVVIRSEAVEFALTAGSDDLPFVPDRVEPTADLAPDQLAAVSHRGGPARIIAPAGSGKTRVLTERLRHLLADRGYDPRTVLAVAYNRKAQEEMAARTEGLGARIQTLNSLGYEIVGRFHGSRPSLVDEREMRRRLEPFLPKMQRRLNTDPMAPYLDGLSAIRLGLRDPMDVEVDGDAPGLAEAIEPYREGLRRDHVTDFDDQIFHAVELLLRHGDFRRQEQHRYRHLLVDEFQDLTPAHVLLVRLLAAPQYDVFGVGDDDQVIYGHAGASPEYLVEFEQYFPGADAHALEVNYRCAAPVVDAAKHVLSYNRNRVAKEIRAHRPDDGACSITVVRHASDQGASAAGQIVTDTLAAGAEPGSVAILARTNSFLLGPHVWLVDAGIPVESNLHPRVLDRVGLRAALAWLRIANDPGAIRAADLAEVSKRPSRGFPRWVEKWTNKCRSAHDLKRASERIDDLKVSAKLASFADDIEALGDVARTGLDTRSLLEHIRDDIGLGTAMELLDGRPGAEGSSHLDDLDGLLQVADLQPDPELFEPWLRTTLAAGGTPGDDAPAGVTLSTVHRVKGQEWPTVVVFGVTAGVFPHRLAEDVEEERRVFHVAVTRGIGDVHVLGDVDRPSRFLDELDGSAPPDQPTRRDRTAISSAATRAKGSKGADTTKPTADDLTTTEQARFEELRGWRAAKAKATGGPAYLILYDATMIEVVRQRPTTLRELAVIKGIGPSKLDAYGDELLELIEGWD